MHSLLVIAALAASSTAVNLGKVAPFHESPFVNIFSTHNGPRENGAYSFDVVPPANGMVLQVQWDGFDPNGVMITGEGVAFSRRYADDYTRYDHRVNRPTRVNVDIVDPTVENLQISWRRDANADFFTQPFLDSIEPFDTLRMLEWTAANTSTVDFWTQRPRMQDPRGWGYGENGVPIEVQVDLANRTGKTLWLPIPHTATDRYQRQLARYLADELDPTLGVMLEYSNEVWNPQFPQFDNPVNYGRNAQALFDIFEQELGDARVTNVLSGQAVSPFIVRTALNETRDAETLAISAYARVEPEDMDLIYSRFKDGQRPDTLVFNLLMRSVSDRKEPWSQHADLAESLGVPLVAYEAGQSIVTYTLEQRDDRPFVDWLNSLQEDDRMAGVYRHLSDTWKEAGGQDIAWYNLSDSHEPSGGWGLRESFSGTSIKWETVMSLIQGESFNDRDRVDVPVVAATEGRWVEGVLYPFGDSNLNRRFDTSDLVMAFSAGEYEDAIVGNSTWREGDWNRDFEFDSSDLVLALQANGNVFSAVAVPEPTAVALLCVALPILGRVRNRGFDKQRLA